MPIEKFKALFISALAGIESLWIYKMIPDYQFFLQVNQVDPYTFEVFKSMLSVVTASISAVLVYKITQYMKNKNNGKA